MGARGAARSCATGKRGPRGSAADAGITPGHCAREARIVPGIVRRDAIFLGRDPWALPSRKRGGQVLAASIPARGSCGVENSLHVSIAPKWLREARSFSRITGLM